MSSITSIKHPLIVSARQLNKPSMRTQDFLIEGMDQLQWALEAKVAVAHVFVSSSFESDVLQALVDAYALSVYQCSDGIMKKINDSRFLTPVIAVAAIPQQPGSPSGVFSVLLENIQDQGNLGTLIRTALALGVNHIITTEKSNDIYNKKTITASRGTAFRVCHQSFVSGSQAVSSLKALGYQVIATSPTGTALQSVSAVPNKPTVLVVGNETSGVSRDVLAMADTVVQIPMLNDVESLNVGVAAGISMYELKLKVLIAMLSNNIRQTLGRDLGVTHHLVRELLNQETTALCDYNGTQVVVLMVMVCDATMSRSQLETDTASYGDALDQTLAPLMNDQLIHCENDTYSVTPRGEELLGKLWAAVERSESAAFKDFSQEEKHTLRAMLKRIQSNCQQALK